MAVAREQKDKMDVSDDDSETMNNKFQCSICLNSFIKPKIIECFHTFCESCLKNYLNNYQGKSDFPCPLCRKRVKIPKNGVNGFMTNFYLEEKGVKVQEPEPPEPKKHLCVHHDKDLDLYCIDCCVTICSKCFRVDHSGHSVSEIEQIESRAKTELEEVNLDAKKNLQTLQKYLEHMKSELLELTMASRREYEHIDEHVKNICDIVKKRGQDFKKEVKRVHTLEYEKLTSFSKDVAVMADQSHRLYVDSSDLLKRNQSHEILDHLPYLKVKCLESENRAHFPVCSVTYPKFVPSETEMSVELFGELTTSLRSPEFALFGSKLGNRTSKWRKSEKKPRTIQKRFGLRSAFKQIVVESIPSLPAVLEHLATDVGFTPPVKTVIGFTSPVKTASGSNSPVKTAIGSNSPVKAAIAFTSPVSAIGFTSSPKSAIGSNSPLKAAIAFTSPVETNTCSLALGHIDRKLQKVNFENQKTFENKLDSECENQESLSKTREKIDSEINSKFQTDKTESRNTKPVPDSSTGIFGEFFNKDKDENSNSLKSFRESFTFQFGKDGLSKESDYPGQIQYDFRFFLNSILEKGSKCRKLHFKTDEYKWVLTVKHETNSKLSLLVELDTLGLYRVSFSLELVNLDNDKNSIQHHEQCYLIHGVWGPGFTWKNFINLDLLADPNNHFLDVDQQFLVRLTVDDDIYRLK